MGENISGFVWRFFLVLNSLQKVGVLIHKIISLLVNWLVSLSSHAIWGVLWNKVISVLGHCWLVILHIHTSDWDFLFFQSCLLSTVTVTPSDSDYVNRSGLGQLNSRDSEPTIASTILCVGAIRCVKEVCNHHGQEAGQKCGFDSSRWETFIRSARHYARRRREETAWKQRRIMTRLVIVIFLSRVMTYVVFNHFIFWNWISVVQFVLHEVWSD